LDEKFLASFFQNVNINSVSRSKTHLWTKEAQSEDIREHANIDVPSTFKYKFKEELLLDIPKFSKIDLGGVKEFFHKFT
jgi:hypothetical protein